MKKNLSSVAWPSLVFLLITLLVQYIDYQPMLASLFDIGGWLISSLVACIIWQVLAYISCWAFVLRNGKPQNYVWINYIVWTILANLGNISTMLNMN